MLYCEVMASVPESDAILLEPLKALGCRSTHSNKAATVPHSIFSVQYDLQIAKRY
jgi:hypothetical protein